MRPSFSSRLARQRVRDAKCQPGLSPTATMIGHPAPKQHNNTHCLKRLRKESGPERIAAGWSAAAGSPLRIRVRSREAVVVRWVAGRYPSQAARVHPPRVLVAAETYQAAVVLLALRPAAS